MSMNLIELVVEDGESDVTVLFTPVIDHVVPDGSPASENAIV
jgi:hypothetical protein